MSVRGGQGSDADGDSEPVYGDCARRERDCREGGRRGTV